METEAAFDDAEFLGLARSGKRDAHRLALFARHFETGERARAVVPVPGGTLIVTDRRVMDLRPHLEVDGAWNVREFQGYSVAREIPIASISSAKRRIGSSSDGGGTTNAVEEVLDLETSRGTESFLLSRGPRPVLTEAESARLTDALLNQAK